MSEESMIYPGKMLGELAIALEKLGWEYGDEVDVEIGGTAVSGIQTCFASLPVCLSGVYNQRGRPLTFCCVCYVGSSSKNATLPSHCVKTTIMR